VSTRRTVAVFPTGRPFDGWPEQDSSIPIPTQQALRTLEWIRRRENLVVCSPSGTGKTFLLEALCQAAIERRLRAAWLTLEDLGVLVRRHRADDPSPKPSTGCCAPTSTSSSSTTSPCCRSPPMPPKGHYRLVDAAREKRSITVSSNLHPAAFDELMPKTLATTTVDRLLHHAHVCQTSGDSVRPSQALSG
jgi:DNA replication protein DnaC